MSAKKKGYQENNNNNKTSKNKTLQTILFNSCANLGGFLNTTYLFFFLFLFFFFFFQLKAY